VTPETPVRFADGSTARLVRPWLPGARRLWIAAVDTDVPTLLNRLGRPISYAYLRQRWSADYYRTVFGQQPGSAEMPSAARPFTDRLVTELVSRGIGFAPITLHTGVSSPEAGEPPSPERFAVSETTARLVNQTRAAGGRVIAVGTTVTRALETAADGDRVRAAAGWTELVLGPDRSARVVDGLITGWHAPGASHLRLLESVAGTETVRAAYSAAVQARYLWHEFGDSALLFG
jgi:S-adenosylmethionine:tRNA ribosyltransferase-isomerase